MKSLVQEWIEALRSKKYKQGRSCLRYKDEFCCLGVLCDIVYPEGWSYSEFDGESEMRHGLPPGKTENNYPIHMFGDFSQTCLHKYANMNDTEDTFDVISTRVENDTNLKDLESHLLPKYKAMWASRK